MLSCRSQSMAMVGGKPMLQSKSDPAAPPPPPRGLWGCAQPASPPSPPLGVSCSSASLPVGRHGCQLDIHMVLCKSYSRRQQWQQKMQAMEWGVPTNSPCLMGGAATAHTLRARRVGHPRAASRWERRARLEVGVQMAGLPMESISLASGSQCCQGCCPLAC